LCGFTAAAAVAAAAVLLLAALLFSLAAVHILTLVKLMN